MRCAAGVGLLLLVGCNQIFGIAQTQPWDAPADVIPDLPHVVLTWQLATTDASGAPQPVSYPPLTGGFVPRIRIAPHTGDFQTAEYQTVAGKEGWILVPLDYFQSQDTWRLEYTINGNLGYNFAAGVPHEVQWSPDEKGGHLVIPMFGRVARDMPPDMSGYDITVLNAPTSYDNPRVLTTGLWTDGSVPQLAAGATVAYEFSSARSLSGTLGAPDPSQGDHAYLVDFGSVNGCTVASGAGLLDSAALSANMHTAATATWDATQQVVAIPPPASDTDSLGRVTANADLGQIDMTASSYAYGVAGSTELPGLLGDPRPQLFALPIPVMLSLLKCPYNRNPPPVEKLDTPKPFPFPYILHAQLVTTRKALNVPLSSGLETVIPASSSAFKLAFPAPLATTVTLTASDHSAIALAGDATVSDGVMLSTTAGTLALAFTVETGADLRADYYDVVLHGFSSGSLTTLRVYTVTAPQVQIDGSLLAPGSDYVFEIRTYKGHVMAAHGDFSAVDYPYGGAIVFTHTFKTP